VLLLVTCATIASCDDFDDIVLWGEHHLDFLRRFGAFSLRRSRRALGSRSVQPHRSGPVCAVFSELDGRAVARASRAIDGKTARRTHDKRKGLKALHTLSAYATNARLTLAQLSVPEKTNEITAIPDLLDHLAEAKQLKGALVTVDAMGCQVAIADKIVAHGADYLLGLKGNQAILEGDVAIYFDAAPEAELATKTTVEKGHGRIETRAYAASDAVDWITSDRSYPSAPRFSNIKKRLWGGPRQLAAMRLKREELLMKLGAARAKARRPGVSSTSRSIPRRRRSAISSTAGSWGKCAGAKARYLLRTNLL